MKSLLRYLDKQIEQLRCAKLNTMDENGEEVECFDGEGIYEDGRISGKLSAYYDIREQIRRLL